MPRSSWSPGKGRHTHLQARTRCPLIGLTTAGPGCFTAIAPGACADKQGTVCRPGPVCLLGCVRGPEPGRACAFPPCLDREELTWVGDIPSAACSNAVAMLQRDAEAVVGELLRPGHGKVAVRVRAS